jgi:hypothetical protein
VSHREPRPPTFFLLIAFLPESGLYAAFLHDHRADEHADPLAKDRRTTTLLII